MQQACGDSPLKSALCPNATPMPSCLRVGAMSPTSPLLVSRFTFGSDTIAFPGRGRSSALVIAASAPWLGSAQDPAAFGGSSAVIVTLPPW